MSTYHRYPPKPPEGFLVVHKDARSSYQFLDSLEGLARLLTWYGAVVVGVRPGIDLDVTQGSNRWVWMTHWNDALGHYFGGPFARATFRIVTAPVRKIRMLRSTHNDSKGVKIPTLHQGITWVGRHNRSIVMCVELKNVIDVATLTRLRVYAEQQGVTLVAMRIQGWPTRKSCIQSLKNAHRAGIWTMLLGRFGSTPAVYFTTDEVTGLPWLDFGKGSRKQYRLAPKGFRRVGLGYGDATAWGCGAHRTSIGRAKAAVARAHKTGARW